jgi:hypothetical protein
MDSHLTTNKHKKSPLILGILSISLVFFGFFIALISWSFFSQEIRKGSLLLLILIILYYVGLILMAIWGLVRGVKMLRLEKKTRAILGIILSLLGLVSAIIIGWLVVGNLMATI